MIEKKTVIDRIEVNRDGSIQIRFGLLLIEDDQEIDCKWHRTAIEPGGDVQATIDNVNEGLVAMKAAPFEGEGLDRLQAVVDVVQTPDVVQKFRSETLAKEAVI